MTSRMIKEPMKVNSADCQQRSAETSRKKLYILIFFWYMLLSWIFLYVLELAFVLGFAFVCLSRSRPCRGLSGGVGTGPVPLHTSLEQYGMNLNTKSCPLFWKPKTCLSCVRYNNCNQLWSYTFWAPTNFWRKLTEHLSALALLLTVGNLGHGTKNLVPIVSTIPLVDRMLIQLLAVSCWWA